LQPPEAKGSKSGTILPRLLAAAQAVEHYEMTDHSKPGRRKKSVKLLQQALDEERATDAALTKLAKAVINPDAEKEEAALLVD
jgi:ferritin-like metal-binding protein YciE